MKWNYLILVLCVVQGMSTTTTAMEELDRAVANAIGASKAASSAMWDATSMRENAANELEHKMPAAGLREKQENPSVQHGQLEGLSRAVVSSREKVTLPSTRPFNQMKKSLMMFPRQRGPFRERGSSSYQFHQLGARGLPIGPQDSWIIFMEMRSVYLARSSTLPKAPRSLS